jgi:hypothetical protein
LRSDQTRSHPELGRQTLPRQWYYVSRPGRVGRCQACEKRKHSSSHIKPNGGSLTQIAAVCVYKPRDLSSLWHTHLDAGWSSPVARQAHNLKVTGSNPVPATKLNKARRTMRRAFCVGQSLTVAPLTPCARLFLPVVCGSIIHIWNW